MRNKKQWKKWMACALSVAMLVPASGVYATEKNEAGIETQAEGGEADADGFVIEDGVLTGYTGEDVEVVIPDGVTSIGSGAFSGASQVRSIRIPEGVTSIGDSAFRCSELESVAVPESVTYIPNYAFASFVTIYGKSGSYAETYVKKHQTANLQSIEFSTEDMPKPAEKKMISEDNVKVSDSLRIKYSNGNEGWGVPAVTVKYEGTVLKEDKDYRIKYADSNSSSGTVEVTVEGKRSYGGTVSKTAAGRDVSAEGFELSSALSVNGDSMVELVRYTGDSKEAVIPYGVRSIQGGAFLGSSVTSITFPASMESIEGVTHTVVGRGDFKGSKELETIIVDADNQTYASEDGVLYDKAKTTLMHVPDKKTGTLNLPASVKSIHGEALRGKTGLREIHVDAGNQDFASEDGALYSKDKTTLICCLGGKTGKFNIPAGVANIGSYAFCDCSGLTSITIPASVTNIQKSYFEDSSFYSLFNGCTGLKEVKVDSRNQNFISENGILYNKDKTEVIWSPEGNAEPPADRKVISGSNVTLNQASCAYDGKPKKPAVTVKDGNAVLKEGTDYTVAYQDNINAGTAKVTVTGKGNYEGAATVTFVIQIQKGTSHTVGAYRYQVTGASAAAVTGFNDKKAKKVKIPKKVTIGGKRFNVTAIGKNCFKKNAKITSVEIADSVKTIGASAFEGCAKLARVTVGKGAAEIGGSAFKNCKRLGNITIRSTQLKKVGKSSLKGIKAAAKVKVPSLKLPAYKKLFKNRGQGKKVKIVK